ncbi:MAG: OmpW family protein [Paraburkholderia sp.]|uniref:OmpW/AlkL family protein n=1 Tax=Paraburkholderia sp. TaxID=1926495 RepID=UPI001217E724|nr:OmpW family outer membrane protein [Paraburkholderia sp.]TAM07381.1 MAG: OmpW family protein [Paraburkholderia sp.]TAM30340.1 MAG: OmpW family protein [Paraburkholderia sp.]
MKLKQALAGVAALAAVSAAHAQSAHTLYVTTGWFHFAPQDSSDPLTIDSVGGRPVNSPIPGTGASVGNADTAGVSLGYFITDNIAAEAELGIPPKFDLSGSGSLSPLGKIGEARMWAPAVLLKYYFNKADSKFRPYLGVGATYVWFTGDSITNQTLTQNIGLIGTRPLAPLGLAGPGVQTSVSTTNSWAPVFSAGFNYNFTKHWFAGFSLSYIPVNVTANLDTTNTAGVHVRSEAKIHLNPIVTYLKVGYAF